MYHHQDSHTDENVPPLNQNRVLRGSTTIASNGIALSHHKLQGNIDTLIHQVEKEAYSHVLLAFKCQSDVLTWEKADLMVELRKELRVSDDEHTQLLTEVNTNSTIHQIREWRKTGCYKPAQHVHDDSLHSTISSSPKNQNSSQLFQHQNQLLPGSYSLKNAQHRSAGERLITNGTSYTSLPPKKPVREELIAEKARTAGINKAATGKHGLYYDSGEANEMEEWVNLNKMPAENIEWENEEEGRPILRILRRQ
ncbi:hypothetical protein PIB30_000921 [Stylosanthes scabra]|uniref:ENT domain-containing protein n=1 Tax=Stylosanthes scabra TaxID=79078 RepID=A0ABU6S200_9FABA|nr:hypothetical protein [Stylosanthes scabra]